MAVSNLLESLNPKQKEAVLHTEGPLLILAGAGSGKTRVIVHRMAYLVTAIGIPPDEILAVTFTNKAAGEMKSRITTLLPEKMGQKVGVSTFHATCLKILRQHSHHIGYKNSFVIYDAQDQLSLIRSAMTDLSIDETQYPPRKLLGLIGQLKNQLISPAVYAEGRAAYGLQQTLQAVYPLYQQKLITLCAVDFDDLIGLTIQLFEAVPDLLARFRQKIQYLMIDEYQDTNYAQYRLTRLLVSERRNLCVVGDDDQSIYAFRGADVGNILKFERDYPDAKVVVLDQNYRSTQAILSGASVVISQNKERKPKTLWTENHPGEPIFLKQLEDEMDEALFIRETIASEQSAGQSLSRFCILYRTHAQSRVMEEGLRNKGIPYVIFGGLRFYERKEIKDLIAYLRVMVYPEDGVSLKRIINVPTRGIGDVTLQKLIAYAELENITLYEAIGRAAQKGENNMMAGAGRQRLSEFYQWMERGRAEIKTRPIADLLRLLIEETRYMEYLKEGAQKEEAEGRVENIYEFIAAAEQFTAEGIEMGSAGEATYKAFLDQIALLSNADENSGNDGASVTLMTLHSAKGLEFEVVFMVGMEEGVFPHARALTSPKEMEEERRLCYVGMTRARSQLYLTYTASRRLYGATHWNPPSRFIKDLEAETAATATRPQTDLARHVTSVGAGRTMGQYESAPFYSDLPEDEARERSRIGRGGTYPPGQSVRHSIFGVGQVIQYDGGEKITVRFSSVGIKKLSLKYAKLEPLKGGR